jgi:hypothetical protein
LHFPNLNGSWRTAFQCCQKRSPIHYELQESHEGYLRNNNPDYALLHPSYEHASNHAMIHALILASTASRGYIPLCGV